MCSAVFAQQEEQEDASGEKKIKPTPADSLSRADTATKVLGGEGGRPIRDIHIQSWDPLGYSLTDSTRAPHNWLQKTGNALHVKSKRAAIDKFLLFEEGQAADTLLIQESARLLREQDYINQVKIVPHYGGSDSVAIEVKVLDAWSLMPIIDLSGEDMWLGIQERNFLGLGHRVEFTYGRRFRDGNNGFTFVYTVPNFKNTFIDMTAKYALDLNHYTDKFIAVQRDFYSALTRWAGGIMVQERSMGFLAPHQESVFEMKKVKFIYQDYWIGRAFRLYGDDTKRGRTTNLVLGLRTYFLDYRDKPAAAFDELGYFSNENFLLGSVSLSKREYVQDRYIFRDGEIEYVPTGSLYAVTAGVRHKKFEDQFYLGLRAAYGNYFEYGFLSGNFEVGSFFTPNGLRQSTLSLKMNYFSKILHLGEKWKMRQFIKPQIVIGFNRLPAMVDRLGLNEEPYYKGINRYEYIDYINKRKFIDYNNGNIHGFRSLASGTGKYVLGLQTQFYSPWKFLGFHFNPYLNMSFGFLGGDRYSYETNNLYASFSLGFVVRNTYLPFDTFQFSLSYFPAMPGRGRNILRGTGYRVENYGFQNFQVEEPRPVIYE